MIGALILVFTIGVGAVGIGYLIHYNAQEHRARETQRREEESRFRAALLHELGRRQGSSFRLSEFIAKCEVPDDLARRVAEDVYACYYRKVIVDGVIAREEQTRIGLLTRALEIDQEQVRRIEQHAREQTYSQAVDGVLADGAVTDEEARSLETLRRGLGISKQDAFRLTGDVSRSSYLATFRRIVRDGVVTPEEQAELLRCKQALALSDDQADSIIRAEAMALYRETFAMVVQDGVVTDAEEKTLAWLKDWAGLPDSELTEYHARMRVVKQLAAYRQGNLPVVETRAILEGGETCHWHGSCTLEYETRTRLNQVRGNLIVTSRNVYFASQVKPVSFKPSRILDIIRYTNGLEIKVNARQGSGRYIVDEAEELEAILAGVVRKHKYLLSESYSSERTRKIPDQVKREVWDRDGGRCVTCGNSDYLEFDHVIPHARGGSNSANNVQILCRRCNLLKSDRI
ncbi:MAG: HNH endonuclease [Isosphaeraceae bacterium]